ncbi:uncharacterized protein LOC110705921 [Chenopodium quinoa]|uniref:uncharacterized protein LOC110705921 n=1 Tax=Chenopodium quinoa TaxID=63459 RepID=UPI000B795C54|nr:uncharacterized protein LOC110705921 [Chenopodium quinoa]
MVEGMDTIVVTLSGYYGTERMMLIKLISLAGANYVGRMSPSTTHLICWKFKGKKYEYAKKFGTLVINHQWLEDCIKEGKCIAEFPYTLHSGQEIGFKFQSLPVVKETTGMLSENTALLNKPNIRDCLNDVIDLDPDEIENDDWDDDLLLDENSFPKPGSRKAARQLPKRKLDEEIFRERRSKANTIHEPLMPRVNGLQCEESDYSRQCSFKQRSGADTSNLPYIAESSHRSRRLVKKIAKSSVIEIATNDAEQSRTHADVNELHVASSPTNESDDLTTEIEASISRRFETAPSVQGSEDEINIMNDLGLLSDTSLHNDDTSNFKGGNMEESSLGVQNFNGDKLGRDQTTVSAAVELSCVICWTEFSSLRGVLPCGHRFCVSCIRNWADHMISNRKEPTCPLCKAGFVNITSLNAAASLDQKIYSQTIPCASLSQDIFFVSEGTASHSDVQVTFPSVCCHCQSRDPEDLLVFCQMCHTNCIHHYCLDPPLFPWTCIGCRDRRLLFRS